MSMRRSAGRRGDPAVGSDTQSSVSDTDSPTSALNPLVAAAAAGDEGARNDLMGKVHQLALRYASARLSTYPGAREKIADVAQEVAIAVLQGLATYEDRGAPFEAFVYRICSFKVADAQRSSARHDGTSNEIPDSADIADTPEEVAVRADTAQRLARIMQGLNDSQREILTLRIGMGLSAEETASWLGMTPGAVRVAQHRALAKLKTLHDKSGEELQ